MIKGPKGKILEISPTPILVWAGFRCQEKKWFQELGFGLLRIGLGVKGLGRFGRPANVNLKSGTLNPKPRTPNPKP